jgi:NitT/TauT family transport system permease protein
LANTAALMVFHANNPDAPNKPVAVMMVNIATGLAALEPGLEDVLRVLGAKRWDVLVKVGLPRSMPYFYGSLKVAITLAFVGTTVSEMTAANEGIG